MQYIEKSIQKLKVMSRRHSEEQEESYRMAPLVGVQPHQWWIQRAPKIPTWSLRRQETRPLREGKHPCIDRLYDQASYEVVMAGQVRYDVLVYNAEAGFNNLETRFRHR